MTTATYLREIALDRRDSAYHKFSNFVQHKMQLAADNGDFNCKFELNKEDYSEKAIKTVFKHLRINGFNLIVYTDLEDQKNIAENKLVFEVSWE